MLVTETARQIVKKYDGLSALTSRATHERSGHQVQASRTLQHLQARWKGRGGCETASRMMDMHSTEAAGASWPRLLRVKADVHSKKKAYVVELGKFLTWFCKAGMEDSVRIKW